MTIIILESSAMIALMIGFRNFYESNVWVVAGCCSAYAAV